ncbi:unnamed protein product [Eruca vesicaria subsp. sativa]|uniref:Nucleotide-diphospho-sugar transferase domain-containing protein n=1 Tax=Eruca vesicaria subsp. sativa TaxID=29727 RepID=A0ABC8JF37_ERUVS|nr:unnamed protein product [Eruca vesicaria subsp. sativa]
MADVQSLSEDDGHSHNSSQGRDRLMVGRRDLKMIAVFLTASVLMCLLFYHYQSPIQAFSKGLTDMDIMWLRDPFPHLFSEGDFQVSCDSYNGNSADKRNFVNTGFKYVRANNRTVKFYKYWYGARWRFRGKKDQDVFNKIKYNRYITEKIRLKIKFLETVYFRGFCQLRREMNKVCTMHANCCVGLQNKVLDLRQVLEDWKYYLSAAATADSRNMTWRSPDHCWGRVKKSNKKRV